MLFEFLKYSFLLETVISRYKWRKDSAKMPNIDAIFRFSGKDELFLCFFSIQNG